MKSRIRISLIIFLSIIVATALVIYLINPYGTATTDPRGRLFGYVSYEMHSQAMMPTLAVGDLIMVSTSAYANSPPEINDVIVFNSPTESNITFVSRFIASEGERVKIVAGKVYVNGNEINQSYIETSSLQRETSIELQETIVPKETMFVLGDNRDNSLDSRYFGGIPTKNLIGKVQYIWFSDNSERVGRRIK